MAVAIGPLKGEDRASVHPSTLCVPANASTASKVQLLACNCCLAWTARPSLSVLAEVRGAVRDRRFLFLSPCLLRFLPSCSRTYSATSLHPHPLAWTPLISVAQNPHCLRHPGNIVFASIFRASLYFRSRSSFRSTIPVLLCSSVPLLGPCTAPAPTVASQRQCPRARGHALGGDTMATLAVKVPRRQEQKKRLSGRALE